MSENINLVPPTRDTDKKALRTALVVSSNRKGSLYNLTKSDRENGYYFLFEGLEVPFKAILQENNKTRGIVGIAFGTAKDCPSQALGLCQVPKGATCYALSGERRATKRDNKEGLKGMDSYYKGKLFSEFWDSFANSPQVRNDFIEYLYSIEADTIRFNLKGDFRDSTDILIIWHLAQLGFKMVGYTARDDLTEAEHLGEHPNCFLNGSNRMYTNRFKVTASIKEFLEAPHTCKGSCKDCQNCYRLRGETITVLVHGKGADTALNTAENREFLENWSKTALPWDVLRGIKWDKKGLLTCLNAQLKAIPIILRFGSHKELIKFIRGTL